MVAIDTQQVVVEKDIVVGRGGARDLLADIYRPPAGSTKQVGVIHVHGGAFVGGSKEGARTARPLAAMGYTCISTQYRLSQEAKWPAQIQDVKACIRWVRTNAGSLGIDPDKIVIQGHSAGGHLALITAGTRNRADYEGEGGNPGVSTSVAACVAFYPPTEARRPHPLLGPDPDEAAYRSVSPITYVAPGFPPTIVLHGTEDATIPVESSVTLFTALRKAGAPAELHLVEGVTHIFDAHAEFAQLSAEWIDLFLDRHVANPRVYPSTEPAPR